MPGNTAIFPTNRLLFLSFRMAISHPKAQPALFGAPGGLLILWKAVLPGPAVPANRRSPYNPCPEGCRRGLTALIRNQMGAIRPTWVRIPLPPPDVAYMPSHSAQSSPLEGRVRAVSITRRSRSDPMQAIATPPLPLNQSQMYLNPLKITDRPKLLTIRQYAEAHG